MLLLPCDSLPPSSVGESLQLFRDAAYEVTEAGDWKQASGLLAGGQSFDVVLAQVRVPTTRSATSIQAALELLLARDVPVRRDSSQLSILKH